MTARAPASAETPRLKALLNAFNKKGARLQVRRNESRPERGPYFVIGSDHKGRNIRLVGTEEFLCGIVRELLEDRPPESLEEIRARLRERDLRQATGS